VIATELPDLDAFYGGTMRPDVAVYALAHTERLLPTRSVAPAQSPRVLARSRRALPALTIESAGRRYDLADYLALNRVAGLLVLWDGEVVLEDYELGFGPDERWASASMAKSVTSTLVGAAIEDGAIAGVSLPVTKLLPELAGGAYEGVTLEHLLRMCSGVGWDETYTDPRSDRRRLLDVQKTCRPGGVIAFMAGLKRAHPPAAVFNYNTGETYLIGMALERAIGEPLAANLARRIWGPAGMEREASWWTESEDGAGVGGSGLAASLRDYGRFGLFVAQGARVEDRPIVPKGWFAVAGAAQTLSDGSRVDYGYQWWAIPRGTPGGGFLAHGIYGQRLYISADARLVVAVLSARSKPMEHEIVEDNAFYASLVRALG
jgi:CubicO group peptidase (beta-lactamase class C family)